MNLFRPDLNPEIRDLILKCLTINFEQRPDALNLRSDSYLSKLLNSGNNFNGNSMIMSVNNSHYQYQNNNRISGGQGYFGKKETGYYDNFQQQNQQFQNNNY
jgi:hypothetical protein